MKQTLTGALTCARYAFAPNFYHYCGPDTHGEIEAYITEATADEGLTVHLNKFETLYPYLSQIAQANNIGNPLDNRVVEAYWVGNNLLDRVTPAHTFDILTQGQQLKKRLSPKDLKWLLPKIDQQARLHHSFHVFNVFTRTGHHTVQHTVDSMDQCRIGWGRVIKLEHNYVYLDSQRLIYSQGKLEFKPEIRTITNPTSTLQLQLGDWVTYHWGFICDQITSAQVTQLKRYTLFHLFLANQTI